MEIFQLLSCKLESQELKRLKNTPGAFYLTGLGRYNIVFYKDPQASRHARFLL